MRNTDKSSPALHTGYRLRRWLGTSALMVVACGGLVWGAHGWSGSEGSLASSLRLASHLMPAGQSMSTDQVSGSLRHGGLVGQWHWQQAALQVRGQGTRITLDWSQLWLGQLPLTRVDMDSLRIDDQNPSSPATPLTQLQWPLKVDLPWRIGRLEWAGPPALEAMALNGRYAFNGTEHLLQLQPFEVAQGRYSLTMQLQAAAPMALQAQLHGQVLGTRTAGSKPLDLVAQASLQGTLAGAEAALTLNAELQAANSPSGMPLKVQAHIAPWQDQPLTQADAQVQQLNLAALWPGAPQTRLSGQASITPQGPSWQIQAQLKNQSPGPWDRHALPMSQLSAQLQRQANGLWQVQQLQAQIAQGQVKGEGQQTTAGWTGQVQMTGIQPDQLHTALAGSALNGQIKAESVNAHTVAVQADLNAEPSAKTQAGLRWERLHLKGLWQVALWDIQSLDVQAADARLQGQLRFQPAQQTAQAQLQWQSPGMHAQAQGLLGPKQGQGEVTLDVSDAALGMAWLKRWPGWTERLQGWQASGPAHSRAQWQGGYQQADTKLQWQTVLPRLTAQANSTEPLHLQKGQLKVQGRLAALQANIEAQVLRGTQTWRLQSQAHAGSSTESLGQWQGHLDSASLQLSTPEQASAWTAQLSSAVPWQWSSGPMAQQLRWQAGRISVQGATPGQAWLQWDAGQWQSSTGPQGAALSTMAWSANIDALPMRWLPTGFGPEVQSDLLLKGQIKWEQTPALKVRAKLERSSGDLRFDADNSASPRIRAGLREASVALSIDDAQAAVQLIWDTEQMGQLQAQGQTRLSHDAQGWHWPDDAPVSGNLTAQLPRVGAWSLLAPPGWRVQGTLETQLSLSGTRQNPQWQGQVRADNLAVRSAVQGIEFSQGQLRARVQGQQVHLDQLSLRGAGAQGGELQTQGQLTWLPPANGASSASPLGQVDMVLNLQAKALRVSNRADRRLAISGQVKAQMQKGQLQLRGQVQADQGLFILPEDSTPTLGSDVVITDKRRPPTPPNATAATTSASFMGTPDVQVTLDLGPDFQVQGQGLTTRLAGQVVLTSNAATKGIPRLSGEVSTEGGRYKAYGQQLNIETGLLRFNGPYDNPLLDILAIRPNLSQRVGVQISGSVNTPKVRLYADPDMPDADKLAWLVLGRSGANGGAESAVLQQAALALFSSNGKTLGSEMAGALGLDEISLANGSRSDIGSSATATGAAVTLGKRLSKDFYLVYETSLKGTFGSFYVFYDLSRRLTLRAQTGQDNALDLIYTVRKD